MELINIDGFGDFDVRYTRNTLLVPDELDINEALKTFKQDNKDDLDVLNQDINNYIRVPFGGNKSTTVISDEFIEYLKTLGCFDLNIRTITIGD